jgi:tetratricopeptide (TPR) repeat protein
MRTAILGIVVVSLLSPTPGLGQSGRDLGGLDFSPQAIRVGDQEHTALRPREALETFEAVLESRPDEYDALWRAAREAVSVGMLAQDDGAPWFDQAVAHARKAVAAKPDGVEGHEWLAISLGQSALNEGPRTKVRLAEEIRAEALRTLELDSLSAAAHHVLGEWHAQVKRLSGLTRWAAKNFLGADTFDQASWDQARSHLERAVELEPQSLINHLALARVYLDLDRAEDARKELREVLERPALEPIDPMLKQEAQELLSEM